MKGPPVFKINLQPEFRSRAHGALRDLPTMVAALPSWMLGGYGKAFAGAFAGWGAVVLVGGLMMSHVSHENCCAVSAPAVAEAPAPAVAVAAPPAKAPPAAAAPAPPPAPVVAAKTTQRVDMTPTASIPVDPPAKPKHKPHKKKAKDLDTHP